jgi:hypothetical protein
MVVGPVLFDQLHGTGIITLKDPEHPRVIPMVTGLWETIAMLNELNRVPTERPTTYELFENLLLATGMKLREVIIDRFENETYYAVVVLEGEDGVRVVDARPSNALALAVRTGAPIWVAAEVYERQAVEFNLDPGVSDEGCGCEEEQDDSEIQAPINEWLEQIRPDDFSSQS